jgi:Flp pilus assembly protein TadD
MAPFPLLILLYAWWKRGRINFGDLKASAPFFAISLLLGAINILAGAWYAQLHASYPSMEGSRDLLSRVALAGTALAFYFAKFFWTGNVLPLYPQWPVEPLTFFEFLPWLVLGGAWSCLWCRRDGWGRPVFLGLGFFLIFIAPFLGFITVSYMKFTWVMDHFLYLPAIGLTGLVVAAVGDVDARLSLSLRPLLRGLVTVLLTLLAFQAHAYSGAYVDELTLWNYTLESTPGSWAARVSQADALVVAGKYPEAIRQYEIVLALRPDDADIHYSLALALARAKQMPEAIREFEETLRLNPDFAGGHNNLGFALAQMGRIPEAILQYEIARSLRPSDAEIHSNLAVALTRSGQMSEAAKEFEEALKLKPNDPNACNNLGFVLTRLGRLPEAIDQFQAALQISPSYVAARDNLGLALAQTGRVAEAIEQFQQALQINPDDVVARQNLARLQSSGPPPNASGKN